MWISHTSRPLGLCHSRLIPCSLLQLGTSIEACAGFKLIHSTHACSSHLVLTKLLFVVVNCSRDLEIGFVVVRNTLIIWSDSHVSDYTQCEKKNSPSSGIVN